MGSIYNVVTSTVFTSIEETFKVCFNRDDDYSSRSNNDDDDDNNNSSLVYLCDDSTAYHSTLWDDIECLNWIMNKTLKVEAPWGIKVWNKEFM